MSYGLDWKTQEDRLSLGFLSRLSVKGKETARQRADDHSVVDSALLDPNKPPFPLPLLSSVLSLGWPTPAAACFWLGLICKGHLFLN